MTSWSSIMEKMGTFPDEMIHIMPGCAMQQYFFGMLGLCVLCKFQWCLKILNNKIKVWWKKVDWNLDFITLVFFQRNSEKCVCSLILIHYVTLNNGNQERWQFEKSWEMENKGKHKRNDVWKHFLYAVSNMSMEV